MLYHLYSGHLYFSAIGLLVAIAALDLARLFDRSAILQSGARVTGLLAVALATFSATPAPLWLAVPSVLLAALYVFTGIGSVSRRRDVTAVVAIVASLTCFAFELPYHLGGRQAERPARVVVVGDSLSSGGFGEARTWPAILGERIGSEVVNLSRPGDTVASAIEGQLPDIPSPRRGDLVIVEVGGNDMLEGGRSDVFEENLAELSGSLAGPGREIVMFELPLLPGRWAWGRAQRRIARDDGVTLIPKRVLAGVLLEPDNTEDGLHLTRQGHERLASAVAEWAGW
jgi:acyl-CoA thioesterase-1